jgi:hypothetical protein
MTPYYRWREQLLDGGRPRWPSRENRQEQAEIEQLKPNVDQLE